MSNNCLDKFELLLKIQADSKKDSNIETALEGLILAINELNTIMINRSKELEISKEVQYIVRSCAGLNTQEGLYLIDEVNELLKEMIRYEDESLCYAKKAEMVLADLRKTNNQIIDLYKQYVDSIKLSDKEVELCDCKKI